MSAIGKTRSRPATIEELLARPETDRYEIVDGELVPKEAASGKHGQTQIATGQSLLPFSRRPGGPPDRPGGWRFASEALIEFRPMEVRRPDIAGWRRERLPVMPAEVPIRVIPDWICEILSPSNPAADTIEKMRLYHEAHVRHYWILDPLQETLTVYRFTPDGFLYVLGARRTERVRAEPFDAIEIPVSAFFGEEEEETPGGGGSETAR